MTTDTQTFTTETSAFKKLFAAVWRIFIGIALLISGAVIIGQNFSPENKAVGLIIALLMLIVAVGTPVYAFYRWFTTAEYTVTTDPKEGMTVSSKSMRAKKTKSYEWRDITETGFIVVYKSDNAPVYEFCNFFVITADGERREFPYSMDSFEYFVDVVNHSATHLPYSWQFLDINAAVKQRTKSTWYQVARKPV